MKPRPIRSALDNFKDPLWMLAIGMAVFFGLTAAFLAFD